MRIPSPGWIDNAERTAAWSEEVFGPVAAVARAGDLAHAIALANDTQFGLGAAAFTNDAAEQDRLCDELDERVRTNQMRYLAAVYNRDIPRMYKALTEILVPLDGSDGGLHSM